MESNTFEDGQKSNVQKKRRHSNEVDGPKTKKVKVDGKSDNDSKKVSADESLQSVFHNDRLSICDSPIKYKFNKKRVRMISSCNDVPEPMNGILYWMYRDQRVQDNWAFIYAQRMALKYEVPLHICFCIVPNFDEATRRQYDFLLRGLEEVSEDCRKLNINFHLLCGEVHETIPKFVKENDIGGIVTDFSPLRLPLKWLKNLDKVLGDQLPICQVDAHNIVPVWQASPKQEYAARTIRKKITDQLPTFLTSFPPVIKHPYAKEEDSLIIANFKEVNAFIKVDEDVGSVKWATPGYSAALDMLKSFGKERLNYFNDNRNDPTKSAVSNLSPWFNFGHLSVQRSILYVKKLKKNKPSTDAFLEEAIIRRELSDNFCFYNKHYDEVRGAPDWAQKTLNDHKNDKREYVYTLEQLDMGKTHDNLWNASQKQMKREGKMHGFLRMYWAKKILEWTKSPEEALKFAIYFNDRYNLDGRDPNGFVGCMWSICGIHDQGWTERKVFGKIRFMNYQGCKRKFNVDSFVLRYR